MTEETTKAVLVEFTDMEYDVLVNLSEQLNVSPHKFMIMALRCYQQVLQEQHDTEKEGLIRLQKSIDSNNGF